MRRPKISSGQRESRWIDYALVCIMGWLTFFTVAEGVSQRQAAWPLMGILAGGTAFSYFAGRALRNSIFLALGGWLYVALAGVAILFQPALNQLLPPETFPTEVWAAGFLTWLLCLGSFGIWADGPLLFQTVPSLALFGLIGVYDTFPAAPYFFFAFLLTLAVLFGRAHSRAMLLQAKSSGFARVEEGLSLAEGESPDALLNAMKRGPWRWMAGPEWALASAGTVVLLSLLGAPIIQQTVKGVSGLVQVNLPKSIVRRADPQLQTVSPSGLASIGTGPRVLGKTVIGVATLDQPRYLRTKTYDSYTGAGWATGNGLLMNPGNDAEAITHRRSYRFQVVLMNSIVSQVPIPAEVVSIDGTPAPAPVLGGVMMTAGSAAAGVAVESAWTPGDPSHPSSLTTFLDEPDTSRKVLEESVLPRIRNFAKRASLGSKTDWDKAQALLLAIGKSCNYNLKTPATPTNTDPVSHFLFTSREGYCDLFASAMVLSARSLGMNARYVTGFITSGEDVDPEGRFVFRQSAAHAWAEIKFRDVGWVIFDATTLAKNITPEEGNSNWERPAAIAVVVLLLGGTGYWLAARFLLAKRLPKVVAQRRKVGGLYEAFANNLGRRSKKRRRISATPDEWLALTKPFLGAARVRAEEINNMFVNLFYGEAPVTDEQINSLRLAVRDFKKVRS